MSLVTPEAPPRIKRRGFITLAAAYTIAAAIDASFPQIPYETEPHDVRDSTLWRLFRGPFGGVMEICGGGDKQSNYWQWLKTEIPDFRPSTLLRGNFKTFVREQTIDDIRMSCHGINEVYRLQPLKPPEIAWRIIFQTVQRTESGEIKPYEATGHIFSGKLKGPIKFMRGNGDVRIYAMDNNSNRISLGTTGPFSRDDKSVDGLLI